MFKDLALVSAVLLQFLSCCPKQISAVLDKDLQRGERHGKIGHVSDEIMAGNRGEKMSGRTADWKGKSLDGQQQSDVYLSDCTKQFKCFFFLMRCFKGSSL